MGSPIRSLNQKKLTENIIDVLGEYILNNQITAGDKLPSQADLAEDMNVSRTALREALAQLEARGVIRQVQGLGTFVEVDPQKTKAVVEMETSMTKMIQDLGKTPGTSSYIVETKPLPQELREIFPNQGQVITIQRTRTADGDPFAFSLAYLRPELITSPAKVESISEHESLHSYIEECCGRALRYFEDLIEITKPPDQVAEELRIDPKKCIYKFRRYHYDEDHTLLMYSIDYYNIKTLRIKTTLYQVFQK